jgi:predicted aldo/keto reductase-like oxidoreductase
MLYRRFGKLDWNVSALGFGAMRLPIIGNDIANIDQPQAIQMVRFAIENGVNYVDTAYVYHQGQSEVVIGKALQDGYRNKVRLATKMPVWIIQSQSDMDKYLDEQLVRLQTDHVDFYLLHALTQEIWEKLKSLEVLNWLKKKVAEGKVNHFGFSFHDEYAVFKRIIDDFDDWAFCQIQYNYVDDDFQAGTKGLEYAASKGLAVIVMEPVAGGKLSMNPPKAIADLWKTAALKRTPTEWALRWVWNHSSVSVVLSGMSNIAQVRENVASADYAQAGNLTETQLEFFVKVKQKFNEVGFMQCTGCCYCLPCPEGVNIPQVVSLLNEYYINGRSEEVKTKYWEHITPESQAKKCCRCGRCEGVCPQKVSIRDVLAEASFLFEQTT